MWEIPLVASTPIRLSKGTVQSSAVLASIYNFVCRVGLILALTQRGHVSVSPAVVHSFPTMFGAAMMGMGSLDLFVGLSAG